MSEQPSGKKVVGRNVAIALGIVCIILIAGLGGAMAYYTMVVNDKNATYDSYASSHTHTNSDFNTLNSTYQTWLDGNKTLLQTAITERDQLQTWLNGNITNYESRISSLNTQITNLQNQIASLNSQISSLNAQIASLQSQINALEAPKLIKVNLKSDDNRPFLGTPYLHVYGEVCNVGSNTAYNCKLHVVAYQSGGVVAIDTYIVLGTISGESWRTVDASPTYGGGALTSWTITPEWTATP